MPRDSREDRVQYFLSAIVGMQSDNFLEPGTTKFFALLIVSVGNTVSEEHDYVARFTAQADFLVLGVVILAVLWLFGGWNSPLIVVGTPSHTLFFIGVLILAAYAPLHLWRRMTDRRLKTSHAAHGREPEPEKV